MPDHKPVPITPVGLANNRFREQVLCGNPGKHRILATPGVNALGPGSVQELLYLVLTFKDEDFRESFEPFGDRDFISLTFRGIRIWAKIDCFDPSMEFLSPDPADDKVTVRVLTVMLPTEY